MSEFRERIYLDIDEMGNAIQVFLTKQTYEITYEAVCFVEYHHHETPRETLIERCNELMEEFGGVY